MVVVVFGPGELVGVEDAGVFDIDVERGESVEFLDALEEVDGFVAGEHGFVGDGVGRG